MSSTEKHARRDRPWVMRTYAGHSTPAESNALYRRNLAKGQTGLSVAFDLPTQTGYDADAELALGEVGKVGVPIAHRGDLARLFEGIPLAEMNTSMTINATAMWLLALYQVVAEEQGADPARLAGTTQNDIIKEYLSRGTYAFPPGPSLRLTTDTIAYAVHALPRWNPINICSYHLQEAGAEPVQEIAYALSTAITVLDAVRDSGQVRPEEMGGIVAAVESGYLKSQLVSAHAERRARIEAGEQIVVGVNAYQETEPNPLTADLDAAIQTVDPAVELQAAEALRNWRAERDNSAVDAALARLRKDAADPSANLMPATLDCARAGATTGEWAAALREVFGEFRAPTGVSGAAVGAQVSAGLSALREQVRLVGERRGRRPRMLVGKPGLDGHSNGAEQIAVRARDAGFEVVYQGIRLTPAQIAAAAVAEDVDVVGLSVLSGSHLRIVPDVLRLLADAGAGDIPVVVGGIIPEADAETLLRQGVKAVFTPRDYDMTAILGKVLSLVV